MKRIGSMTLQEACAREDKIYTAHVVDRECRREAEALRQREIYNDWLPYTAPVTKREYWGTMRDDD